jgi:hypothetical protein
VVVVREDIITKQILQFRQELIQPNVYIENTGEIVQKKQVVQNPLGNVKITDKRGEYNVNRQLILNRLQNQTGLFVKKRNDKPITEKMDFNLPIVNNKHIHIGDEDIYEPRKDNNEIEEAGQMEDNLLEEDRANIEEQTKIEDNLIEEEIRKTERIELQPETVPDQPVKKPRKNKKGEPENKVDKPAKKPAKKQIKYGNVEQLTNKLIKQLPKPAKMIVKASPHYMNNRKLYIDKLSKLFKTYSSEIETQKGTITCEQMKNTQFADFTLLNHQKIVREYLNIYTPYRGLLLYHGLGSGKTCTSIAIAEGMKTARNIVLMTPASLKMNFFSEIKKCGDVMYKKNQYWEFISTEGNSDYIKILASTLSISEESIHRNKGAWVINVTEKTSNFTNLSASQQKEIDEQLNEMIRSKYTDINYNGITRNLFNKITKDNTVNPFDNKTVIIDEAHNFVSRIVNKLKKPDSISYMLYHYLMSANNARIVLLTGTPIINYPNELGILFNILRGYIKTWKFQVKVKTTEKINRDVIMDMFHKEKFYTFDFLEYSANILTITRNPYGFINQYKNPKTHTDHNGGGTKQTKPNTKTKSKPKTKNHRKTPSQNKTKRMCNTKSNEPENNPEHPYTETNGILTFNKIDELPIEDDARVETEILYKGLHEGGGKDFFDLYNGVQLDETGNISDEQFVNTIKRIFNNTHKLEITEGGSSVILNKALPDDSDTFFSMFIDGIQTTNQNIFMKRILGLTSYFRSAQEQLLPRFIETDDGSIYHEVKVEMSDYQFSAYEKIRKDEADVEKKARNRKTKMAKKGLAEDLFNTASTYRIFSRACCNFAFPDPPGRPMPDKKVITNANNENETEYDENVVDAVSIDALLKENQMNDDDIEEENQHIRVPLDYNKRIQKALEKMKDNYLTKENLQIYSPKFLKLLEHILDEENRGLHLVYSQFRTIEGIGIIKLMLEQNGFAEFKIQKNSADVWEIVNFEENKGKPHFVLYTGTETPEEKEIIRNIWNSSWEFVPSSISDKLKEVHNNNFYGELVRVLMITSSGAEGINLRNTRFVHIVEPYWHFVRSEQVIGRARRICSHQDLPEEMRTVKVFIYISIFSETHKTNKQNIELMTRDVSKIDERPITTDESLAEIATIKNNINQQLLKSVKETAIDCELYSRGNKSENLVCYNFGKIKTNQFGSYPTLEHDFSDTQANVNKTEKIKLQKGVINGKEYAFNKKTGEVYDLESYNDALEGRGQLKLVGNMIKRGKQIEVVFI